MWLGLSELKEIKHIHVIQNEVTVLNALCYGILGVATLPLPEDSSPRFKALQSLKVVEWHESGQKLADCLAARCEAGLQLHRLDLTG